VILIAKNARIRRPRKAVEGIESVLKVDQLHDRIDRRFDEVSAFALLRVMGTGEIESIGRQLAQFHAPKAFDWPARFGLSAMSPTAVASAPQSARSMNHGEPSDPSGELCARCGESVSFAERKWCRINSARYGGNLYCRSCQPIVSAPKAAG
jgi:hypothetical protein